MFLRYLAGPYSEPAESSLLHHILYSDIHFHLTSSRLDVYLTSGLPLSVFGLIFCVFFVLLIPYIFLYSVYWSTNALNNIQHNVIYDKYHHYMFRHWSAIFREPTNTKNHKYNTPLQV